ncbi:MAG: ATP phosphoribosyltransferase [Paenibacillaceae bacterium]|nr:ATP phosphoribosyltransferase [Paenibacillaceae bacterium]
MEGLAMARLRLAVPKGRIGEQFVRLWRRAGFVWHDDDSRKLIVAQHAWDGEVILAKPSDVATYVEYGAADIGVVGKDMLLEWPRRVHELLDLRIGACRMCVIGLPTETRPRVLQDMPRVATKYPAIAAAHFRSQGLQVDIVPLHGSIELAPLVGLADRIVDLVETGATARDNGLVVYETLMPITSRFICNRASFRLKNETISHLCDRLSGAVQSLNTEDEGNE